uniref:Hd2 n=1 Tax=Rhizophagus irregularis TaxID=588596 RepID=A0A141W392_9GLOM|nr:HD2 AMF mating type protein [Rhizophagus irregularis]AMM63122.1 hd2 [Rhizophagus irregularis]
MEVNVQTLREIRIKLSKFRHDSSHKVVNSPIRKHFFEQFYNSIYDDESKFISLFQNQMSTKLVEPSVDNAMLENLCGDKIEVYNMYCEKVKSVSEQKCREKKLTLLRSYFILPNGGSEHVQEILAKIDRAYSSMISKTIREFQNIIIHHFVELHNIRPPIKVDIGSRFTDSTKQILEAFYEKNDRPNNNEKIKLSHKTELTVKQIETWFNNRRNREEKNLQELEARTEIFLKEEMDWEEMFNAIESGKETSKDMIIFTTAALGLSDEIKETTNKSIEVCNNNSDEATSSFHNSLVIRSRVTRGSHKSTAAPYTKRTPMVTKITKTRSNIEVDASPENPIQISVEDSKLSSSKVITSNKLKYRPSKLYSRDKAHPYRRADKQKCLNSSPPNAIVKTYDIDEYCSSWQMNTNEYESPALFSSTSLTDFLPNLFSDESCSNWQMNTNEYEYESPSLSLSSSLTDFLQNQFTDPIDPIDNTFNYYHDNNFAQYNFNDTQSSEIHGP